MDSNSSPGRDGFNAHFFKTAWNIVQVEVVKGVQNFFKHNKILSGINDTRLALIPKSVHPDSVSQYRPIACCNVIYKCITKTMAARLKTAMSTVISNNQSAFLPTHDITDNIILSSELMRGYDRNNISPRCVLKLDIQKAFDSV